MTARPGGLHHLELWVADLDAALPPWRWLLERLGWLPMRTWPGGASWRFGEAYLVLESGPDVIRSGHERTRPGLNHVAFHAGGRGELDALVADAGAHGWRLLFADRHPYAGGPEHYAAYLEDAAGFEVELVAAPVPPVDPELTAGSGSA
jgi:catechol 2,3-dioxygenase-like lactoylglutathione lyase family enzyme